MANKTRNFLLGIAVVAAVLIPNFASAQFAPTGPTYSNVYPAQSFTAASQTGSQLGVGGSSYAIIEVNATTITTASFQLLGSIDNGLTYTPLNMAALLAPGTLATTETATTTGTFFIANTTGFTNVKLATTSATFTATGLTIRITTSNIKGLI